MEGDSKVETKAKTGLEKTVEWSATGRMGVSLAGMAATSDVNFAAPRCVSRISDMCAARYWEGSPWARVGGMQGVE
jgi:hypothetical protein